MDSRESLWISTENGLSKFDPNTSTFKNYNRSDGLLCKEFNFNSHHRDPQGFFYFGGYNGVAWFHPDSISENRVVPPLAFTAVRLFNKEIKANDEHRILESHVNHSGPLTFRHNQNIFSVEFSVLNYINSRKNQFAYKLAGFEQDWNYVKEPVATYMNLVPGKYTLLSFQSKHACDKPLILLVEDNEEIRTYMREILKDYYEVLESRNGFEGFAIGLPLTSR